jgi:type II secretory pathway pseudopilin PulG
MKRTSNGRAFSMIELMFVILIIALVVAIIIPALGSVRENARDQATRDLMVQISQSISQFNLSERRLPGYFTAAEMGDNQNLTEGFLALDNAMLELAGGIVPSSHPGAIQVGPTSTQRVYFHPDAIGSTGQAYFLPPARYYKTLNGSEHGSKVATNANQQVPTIVDAHGTPILLWAPDPAAVGPIKVAADFARPSSAGNSPARFYGYSNAAVLNGTAVGKKTIDQSSRSLINPTSPNGAVSLVGVLGSPGSPIDATLATASILPSAPRGSFILHSAGAKGVFVGREERGGGMAGPSNTLFYGFNFKTLSGQPHLDSAGKPSSIDIMKDFDDILLTGS